ncbi:Phage protein [Fimbriiglobus ruber]|uniref:Phage protein n=1 Tax=Fimbriiglobus ruber TaxID=1908690 RepID=A0A225DN20_9BACT|nr:Phage protein [Fimbriiglobus ruber]
MPEPPARRKQPWSNRSQKGIIKGKPLNPCAAIEQRYYNALHVLIARMLADTELELRKLFKTEHAEEYFAQDASISSQARILTNALIKKYTDLFASLSRPMAEEFARESNKSSDIAVKSSIRHLSDELTLSTKTITSGPLNDILTATVAENVGLIKSIPAQYLGGVQGAVMRSITTGNGMQDLVPYLQKHKGITLRRARFIAQDQTKKAMTALSFERMKRVGITSAIWRHTSGSRHPRKTHIDMDGKQFNISEGLYDSAVKKNVKPGELPGCACRAQPILQFNED